MKRIVLLLSIMILACQAETDGREKKSHSEQEEEMTEKVTKQIEAAYLKKQKKKTANKKVPQKMRVFYHLNK